MDHINIFAEIAVSRRLAVVPELDYQRADAWLIRPSAYVWDIYVFYELLRALLALRGSQESQVHERQQDRQDRA
jgi:hypothetical protein